MIVKDHKIENLISKINNLFSYEVRKHGSRKEIERVVLKWFEEEGLRVPPDDRFYLSTHKEES